MTHTCACCAAKFTGEVRASVHRDGFGRGPEVVLCWDCGGSELPTLEWIWSRIAERKRAGAVFEVTP